MWIANQRQSFWLVNPNQNGDLLYYENSLAKEVIVKWHDSVVTKMIMALLEQVRVSNLPEK